MFCITTGNIIPGIPANWTQIDAGVSTGSTPRGIRGAYRCVSGDSATVSLSLSSTNWILQVVELSGVTALTGGATQLNASGTNNTPSVTPTAGSSGIAVFCLSVKSNQTYSAQAMSGSNVGTVSERQDAQNPAVASTLTIVTAPVTTVTGAYQGSGTPTGNAAGSGGLGFFRSGTVSLKTGHGQEHG